MPSSGTSGHRWLEDDLSTADGHSNLWFILLRLCPARWQAMITLAGSCASWLTWVSCWQAVSDTLPGPFNLRIFTRPAAAQYGRDPYDEYRDLLERGFRLVA